MSYSAIVTRLTDIRPYADPSITRIRLATVAGHQVVVGLDACEGELGVFFPTDGCLSPEMLMANRLYSTHPTTGEKMGGYFGKNGRVRAQRFKGEKSDGFWTELRSLEWTGIDLSTVAEGFQFTTLNGKPVCWKYISPATARQARHASRRVSAARQRLFGMLKEHFDTPQLRYEIGTIEKDSILYLSEKCHGTSGRTGHILAENPVGRLRQWLSDTFGILRPKKTWQIVSGTRHAVLDPALQVDTGFFSGKTFRIQVHKRLAEHLPKGVTLFYEIVGYAEDMTPIMPIQPVDKISDKELRKQVRLAYGDSMAYTYGCDATTPFKVYVYRATMTNEEDVTVELPWPQVTKLCAEIGVDTVPVLEGPLLFAHDAADADEVRSARKKFLDKVENFLDQESSLCSKHIREGVCVRIEDTKGRMTILKDKGILFKILESIVKDDPDVVDIEEVESTTSGQSLEEADGSN